MLHFETNVLYCILLLKSLCFVYVGKVCDNVCCNICVCVGVGRCCSSDILLPGSGVWSASGPLQLQPFH